MVLDFLANLAIYGYVGAFAISVLGSATVLLPIPYFIIIFGLASTLNPLVLTLVTAVGSAIGELVGFFVGRLGNKVINRRLRNHFDKHIKWINVAEMWFRRNGFFTLVFLAAAPLPTDIGGIIAGGLKYDVRKFFLAMVIGKSVKFAAIIYTGFYSFNTVAGWLGFI